jgi:methylamine dehydrogenase heavy chain
MSFRFLSALTACLVTSIGMAAFVRAEIVVPDDYAVELDGPLTNVVIEDQVPGEHRVWVHDWAGALYSKAVLFNAEDGSVLGSVETGWEGLALDIPRSGDLIYNSALYMSRGYHGERTDVVEMFDPATLNVVGEIAVPPKAGRGIPNRNHSDISDDDRFLFLTFFTPAASVGVVDLHTKEYVGEIETTGCAYVLASGPRQFFVICGDGSLLAVDVDDVGKEESRKRYGDLFDAIEDPLHGTAERSGDTWYFTSHRGVIHAVDVAGDGLNHKVLFDASAAESETTAWVPAEMMQNLAVHGASRRLFLLVGEQDMRPKGGGTDFHRKSGTEVRVFDIDSGALQQRIQIPNEAYCIAVSQDESPYLYSSSTWVPSISVFDADSGDHLRDMVSAFGSMNTIIQPVEPR